MAENREEKIKRMYYDHNLPKNFFDDIVLTPDFYKPENYELEISTHNSIRNMLFYQTSQKIKKVEFFHLKKESDYFQFNQVERYDQSYMDKFVDYLKFKFYGRKLIAVKLFIYERNTKTIQYKAKYYHDLRKENFYCIVSPFSYFDKIIMFYYNKFNKID